jgi:hypothetical protein
MGFMQPEIENGLWLEVDTRNGMDVIPYGLVGKLPGLDRPGDQIEWEHVSGEDRAAILNSIVPYVGSINLDRHTDGVVWIRLREGYGARLSAPGYLDCTDWCVFETEQEARDHLEEAYGDDEETDDE